MAPRARFLGAEGRAEAVNLAEGGDVGLVVELAGLREEGRLAEVVNVEERGGLLAGGGRNDRRVHQQETLVIQPVAHGADNRGANSQNRPLAAGAHPQMAPVHQELNAVLLGRDGKVLGRADQLQAADADFIAARQTGRARVTAHHAGHANGGFLGQAAGQRKVILVQLVAKGDALDDAAAIAQPDEVQPPLAGAQLHPALQQDLLAFMGGDVGDADEGRAGHGLRSCAGDGRGV